MKKIIGIVLLVVGIGISGFAAYGYFLNEYQNHCKSSTDRAAALFMQSVVLKGTDRGRELLKEFERENTIAETACKNASQTQQRAMWMGLCGLVLILVSALFLFVSRRRGNIPVLTSVLVVLTAFGVGCNYLKVVKNESPKPSNESNSNNSTAATNQPQTFPDPNPEKKADFNMTASDFYKEALALDKQESGFAKYKGKIIELSGRVYLLQPFNGKTLDFLNEEQPVAFDISSGEADKLNNLKESERLRIKCKASGLSSIRLIDCVVLERKPALTTDERPDISVTAMEYWEQVIDLDLDLKIRQKNLEKYFGKVIEITGKVRKVTDETIQLKAYETNSVICYYDKDSSKQFDSLKEGQLVTIRATTNKYLLHACMVMG